MIVALVENIDIEKQAIVLITSDLPFVNYIIYDKLVN